MLPRKKCKEAPPSEAAPALTTEAILDRIHSPCRGLQPVIRFVFQSEGKRLRPRLLCLSARLFEHASPHLAEAATLVEALHNGTLLHDDVMDRARIRRNRPTVNRLWGNGVAVLAGDFLLAAVMDLALRTGNASIPPLAVETLMELVEGQMMELQNLGNLRLSERTGLQIIRKKTASLFGMACRLGGLLGCAAPERLRALETFGLQVGTAFQLLDDVRDYLSDQTRTGKEPGRDLAEGKVTLPVLVAFRQADPRDKMRIRQIFSDPGRALCLREITNLVESHGGFSYTLRKAEGYVRKAVSVLRLLPPCGQRADIEQAAWEMLRENSPYPALHPSSCSPAERTPLAR